jgi:hypothetical protein
MRPCGAFGRYDEAAEVQLLAHIEPREARELRRRAGRIIAELEHADLKPLHP